MPDTAELPLAATRVLVVAPTGKDAALAARVLGDYQLHVEICPDVEDLCQCAASGVGVIVLAEEALHVRAIAAIDKFLADEPPWSDPPIILLSSRLSSIPPQQRLRILKHSGNVHVLERPLHGLTLVSSVQVALRARSRQYEVKNLLEQRETVLSSINDSFVMLDREGRFIYANGRASEMYGMEVEELIGRDKWEVMGDTAQPQYRALFETAVRENKPLQIEFFNPRTQRWYEKRFYPTERGIAIFATDITDRVREAMFRREAEEQLKAMNQTLEKRVAERTAVAEKKNAQLRALASELTEVEQRERRRLAHVLHDSLQQMLVATKLRVGSLRKHATEDELREALEQIDGLIDRSIEESRSLTVELSPPILYEGGLCRALHWLARRIEADHHFKITLDCGEDVEPAGDDLKAFLFQAVREFLLNVIKHAGVSEASVNLKRTGPSRGTLCVSDAGAGFDPGAQSSQTGGFGLFSIRERIEGYGGSLEIQSRPGNGTDISLHFPVPKQQEDGSAGPGCDGGEDEAAAAAEAPDAEPCEAIRVLLVDDHQMVRAGLATLLQGHPDIAVVSEASDGLMALELVRSIPLDVVVMDVSMPRLNGVEATRQIRMTSPHVKVIGLSMHEKEDMANAMRDAGAMAYITKSAASETLAATIRACCGREEPAFA